MIARPKISRNEWKTAEIGAFEVGNFALFCCPVADGQMLDLPEAEGHDVAVGRRGGPSAREHLRRHVDADDAAGRAHELRGGEAVDARARTEVDDDLAGLQVRRNQGVAAA